MAHEPRKPRKRRPPIPIDRARSRISAFVYGDILVLGVVLTIDIGGAEAGGVHLWPSVVALAATTVTTYVAHIVAHAIGERVGRTSSETALHLRDEVRDALPIASAGLPPAIIIAIGALGFASTPVVVGIAAAVVVLRLAFVGTVVARLTGERAPIATVLSGVVIAVIGAVIAIVEVALTH